MGLGHDATPGVLRHHDIDRQRRHRLPHLVGDVDGELLGDALAGCAGRVDPAARPLFAALAHADRYGVPLGPTLDRLGADARDAFRRDAQERARRLPVALLVPLVFCILPAFLLLTIVPLLAASLDGLT